MVEPGSHVRKDPIPLFKPREFLLGLVVAVVIVFTVAGTRWFVRARTVSAASSCQANLKQLQAAKENWASERQARAEAVPNWSDLLTPKAHIPQKPVCPQGGAYTLGGVGQAPRCSIPDHALP